MDKLPFFALNAIAFDAEWKHQYEETDVINQDFNNSDGSVSRVKMLKSCEGTYFETSEYEGFSRPYKDTDYIFVAFVPKNKDYKLSIADINTLDAGEIQRYPDSFKTVDKFWIGGNKHGCITDYFYP